MSHILMYLYHIGTLCIGTTDVTSIPNIGRVDVTYTHVYLHHIGTLCIGKADVTSIPNIGRVDVTYTHVPSPHKNPIYRDSRCHIYS